MSDSTSAAAGNPRSRAPAVPVLGIIASIAGSVIASRYFTDRLLFTRISLIGIALELASLAAWKRRRVWRTLKDFFTADAHPLNLTIFRMVVFREIFRAVRLPEIVSFAGMPAGLKFAPWGMGALLPLLPVRASFAAAAAILLTIFSITGFVGLFSRLSALACALLAFYALGIPNFYGKVDHNHHLLWFALILAVSRCGDFLSVDAIVTAWRRADRGAPDPPAPSRAYALPLRFVMLLTGLVYFFPGFWKLWQSGFDWFLTDNLPRQLHLFWSWSFHGLWVPKFRIDRHPLLCGMAGAATIAFELSFVPLVFTRRFRVVPALEGIAFHASTNAFMGISFVSLRNCYVAFFDWAAIGALIGRAIPGKKTFSVYDEADRSSRRLAGIVQVLDVFQRATWISLRQWEDLRADGASEPGRPEARVGLAAPRTGDGRRPGVKGITLVGCLLVLGVVIGGSVRRVNGWPFACYPTFSRPPVSQIPSLGVDAVGPSGSEREVTKFGIPLHRFYGLSRNILAIEDPALRNRRLLLLWKRAVETAPGLGETKTVRFYASRLWIDPDQWWRNPGARTLIFEWRPSPSGELPDPFANVVLADTEWQ